MSKEHWDHWAILVGKINAYTRDVTRRETLGINMNKLMIFGWVVSVASSIRSIGTVTRAACLLPAYKLGVGLANLPHTAHAHNRPYTVALIPTRPSRCTQNSGRAFIFVGSIYFRSLALHSASYRCSVQWYSRPPNAAVLNFRVSRRISLEFSIINNKLSALVESRGEYRPFCIVAVFPGNTRVA